MDWRRIGAGAAGVFAGLATVAGVATLYRYFTRPQTRERAEWDAYFETIGAPPEITELAAAQRWTESRGNPRAGLGIPRLFPFGTEPRDASVEDQLAEAASAAKSYDRNAAAMAASPFARDRWIFGTGGAYGLNPTNAVSPFFGTQPLSSGEIAPRDIFDEWRSSVLFADMVRRIAASPEFRSLPANQQNIAALKRGLASMKLIPDWQETNARSRSIRATLKELSSPTADPDFRVSRGLADARVADLSTMRRAKELLP